MEMMAIANRPADLSEIDASWHLMLGSGTGYANASAAFPMTRAGGVRKLDRTRRIGGYWS